MSAIMVRRSLHHLELPECLEVPKSVRYSQIRQIYKHLFWGGLHLI